MKAIASSVSQKMVKVIASSSGPQLGLIGEFLVDLVEKGMVDLFLAGSHGNENQVADRSPRSSYKV